MNNFGMKNNFDKLINGVVCDSDGFFFSSLMNFFTSDGDYNSIGGNNSFIFNEMITRNKANVRDCFLQQKSQSFYETPYRDVKSSYRQSDKRQSTRFFTSKSGLLII
jgi:hypothetical protein